MERDYDYSSAVHAGDLEDAAAVGNRAGERAVKPAQCAQGRRPAKVPVVYDPRVAGSLLRHLVGAISGPAVARGTSFLKDKLGAARLRRRASPSSTIRTSGAACAPSRSTARACATRAAPSSPTACSRPGSSISPRRASSASPPPAMPAAAPAGRPARRRPISGSSPAPVTAGELIGDIAVGLLCHRADGHGRQRRHRRLQPRRRRLLDRERRARLSGERADHRRQSQGHVPAPDARRATCASAPASTRRPCASTA